MARLLPALALVASAGAASAQDVVVTRTLPAGSPVTSADLRALNEVGEAMLPGLVGLETRRNLFSGTGVTEHDLGPPTVVQRNDIVIMRLEDSVMEIRTEGRALGDGSVGELIRVMNLSSRISVVATVTGPGSVTVTR